MPGSKRSRPKRWNGIADHCPRDAQAHPKPFVDVDREPAVPGGVLGQDARIHPRLFVDVDVLDLTAASPI